MLRECRAAAAGLLGLLCLAHPSPAQSPPVFQVPASPSPGVLALGRQDFFWSAAVIFTAVPAQIRYSGMDPVDTARLDPGEDLWPIDRWAAGIHSERAAVASNVLIAPLLALPLAATAWDSHAGRQTWEAAAAEAFIYGEAMLLSSSLNLLVRSTQVHPRPLVYDEDLPAADRLSGEASGSFYSGHANAAFLSAVFFSYTYSLRHPDSEHLGLIWAGSLGAATVVAGMRVSAGKHFPSDVLVGAGIGSLFGWGFPYLHLKKRGDRGLGMGMSADALPVLTWTF
jgi:membrane-associated phospholipid phosphatase